MSHTSTFVQGSIVAHLCLRVLAALLPVSHATGEPPMTAQAVRPLKRATPDGRRPTSNEFEEWGDLPHDDIGNAERFATLHGHRIRFVHAWGTWVVWDDTRWQIDHKGVMVLELAKDVPRKLHQMAATDPLGDTARSIAQAAARLSSRGRLEAMVALARGIDGVMISHDDLDSDPWALAVTNGWVDLRTGEFNEPDPDKLMTMCAGAEWDARANAPLWEKALIEWMPNPELRDYFQRLCGASLVGQIKDHMLVVVYGPGGNGKSTALGTIARVLGDYYIVPHKSLLVVQKHEPHDTVKASLFRVRMAVAAESDKRMKLNEASVKELTGGDRLRARRMYENEWSFEPTHHVWLQTNYLPEVSGTDAGIWRRIRVLPWLNTFTGHSEDRDLPCRLDEEKSGILNWLLEGVARWHEVGLTDDTVPDTVASATAEYRETEDIVGRWARDTGLILDPSQTTPGSELADIWKEWTEAEFGRGFRFNDVSAWLEAHGCRKDSYREQRGGRRQQVTIWHGVGWTLPATEPDTDLY
jgi:putative DNA primase/helicase